MAFPAHGEAAELVQQGEGLFDDVAQLAQAFDAGGLTLRDDRFGTTLELWFIQEALLSHSGVASSTPAGVSRRSRPPIGSGHARSGETVGTLPHSSSGAVKRGG